MIGEAQPASGVVNGSDDTWLMVNDGTQRMVNIDGYDGWLIMAENG